LSNSGAFLPIWCIADRTPCNWLIQDFVFILFGVRSVDGL